MKKRKLHYRLLVQLSEDINLVIYDNDKLILEIEKVEKRKEE